MSRLQTIRERNRRKRLLGWILFYLLFLLLFLLLVLMEAGKVNTLGFTTGQITVSTSKTKYTAGETVVYTLRNGLSKTITLEGACPQEPLHVYEWSNHAWARVHATAAQPACTAAAPALQLGAGQSVTRDYAAWPGLFAHPGIYRLVALADNYNGLPYVDFQVVAKPAKPTPAPAPNVIYQPVYVPVYVPTGGGGGTRGGDAGGD